MGILTFLITVQSLKEEIISFEEIDETIDLKIKNFENSRSIVLEKALKLSELRKTIIEDFETQIKKELLELSFKSVIFKVEAKYIAGDDSNLNENRIKFTKKRY